MNKLLEKTDEAIPIYINLPSLKDPVCEVLNETLSKCRITEEERVVFQQSDKKLVLVLDGYDEIKKAKNIFVLSNLSKWNCKVIITCRSQFLVGNYNNWFAPNVGRLAEIKFIPFNQD